MVFAKIWFNAINKIERCFLQPAIILAIDFSGQKKRWQQLEINARIDSPGSDLRIAYPSASTLNDSENILICCS